ncbi:hypothetical protein PAALTS15_13592 [Paenibacillus alvei TS-15]|uniref:Uncharacterized protein n=1 Tax=Paenibacillus alvei TS-15 TaxID=1117108 RepID=S9TWR8_PAEAL|nr:hypothetical protein [Paenibacillus alvei]EPY06641.1 hypothetical protein PAALTS15_13592 [Paenibacillus alvei TS-15]
MAGGRKNKYQTHVEPKLLLVEAWARDGVIDEDIAKKLGVAYSTFREYVKKYSALSAALKKGKEVADVEVENALFKRATGYEFTEKKYVSAGMTEDEYAVQQQIAVNQYKLEHPEATMVELRAVELSVSKYKMVLVEEKTKEVSPDVTAQIFWLKNRRPDKWRDKQEIGHSGNVDINNPYKDLTTDELRKLIRDG